LEDIQPADFKSVTWRVRFKNLPGTPKKMDDPSGATSGRRTSTNAMVYLVPVDLLLLKEMVVAGVMARKTSDANDIYAEPKWIVALIMVQLLVSLMCNYVGLALASI
jgi:hypothetical protein